MNNTHLHLMKEKRCCFPRWYWGNILKKKNLSAYVQDEFLSSISIFHYSYKCWLINSQCVAFKKFQKSCIFCLAKYLNRVRAIYFCILFQIGEIIVCMVYGIFDIEMLLLSTEDRPLAMNTIAFFSILLDQLPKSWDPYLADSIRMNCFWSVNRLHVSLALVFFFISLNTISILIERLRTRGYCFLYQSRSLWSHRYCFGPY